MRKEVLIRKLSRRRPWAIAPGDGRLAGGTDGASKEETTTKERNRHQREKPPSEIETTTKVETTTKAGIEQLKGGGEVGRGAQDFPGPIYIQVLWRLSSLHQTSWLPPDLTPPMLIPSPACPAANQPATRPGRRCGPDGPSTRSSPSPATSAAPTGGASGRRWPTRTGLCSPTSSSATPN